MTKGGNVSLPPLQLYDRYLFFLKRFLLLLSKALPFPFPSHTSRRETEDLLHPLLPVTPIGKTSEKRKPISIEKNLFLNIVPRPEK